jgi:hypothetical protein
MTDPVITIHGTIFQKEAILDWLVQAGENTCPITGKALSLEDIISDKKHHMKIQMWQESRGYSVQENATALSSLDDVDIARKLGLVVHSSILEDRYDQSVRISKATKDRKNPRGLSMLNAFRKSPRVAAV